MKTYSIELKNMLKNILSSSVCTGDYFVKKQIIPFTKSLFMESLLRSDLKFPQIDIKELPLGDKTRFAMSWDANGHCSFVINEKALCGDYAGFGKGPHYNPTISQRNMRLIDVIGRVFHEERHVEQRAFASSKDFAKSSPLSVVYAKEILLTSLCQDWYVKHHDSFYIEQEANQVGYIETAKIIADCMPNSQIAERAKRESESGVKHYSKFLRDYFKNDGIKNCDIISQKFDELLKNKNINGILQTYPILKLIYNENGTKKTLQQVLEKCKQLLQENKHHLNDEIEVDGLTTTLGSNINSIFRTIIKSDFDLRNEAKPQHIFGF